MHRRFIGQQSTLTSVVEKFTNRLATFCEPQPRVSHLKKIEAFFRALSLMVKVHALTRELHVLLPRAHIRLGRRCHPSVGIASRKKPQYLPAGGAFEAAHVRILFIIASTNVGHPSFVPQGYPQASSVVPRYPACL